MTHHLDRSPRGALTRRAVLRTGALTSLATGISLSGAFAPWGVAEVAAGSRGAGKKIRREALRHKGAKYVWGGNTPNGFDCSGFTMYVVKKAIGLQMSQALPDQYRTGRRVGKGKWRDGDLVFFENTYKKGLSHVGIYIGKGKFIHAQNEQTGVVITDMDADYYKSRYRGARRVA